MTTEPASKLRVVFDTNVYFSAFTHPLGPPFRIWKEAVQGKFILLVSFRQSCAKRPMFSEMSCDCLKPRSWRT